MDFPDEESRQRVLGRQTATQSAGRVAGEYVLVSGQLPQIRRRLQSAQLPDEVNISFHSSIHVKGYFVQLILID